MEDSAMERGVALREILEEREVEVDLLVAGAVEGPDGRARGAARRVDAPAEEHHPRIVVLAPHLAEELGPDVLGVGEDDA